MYTRNLLWLVRLVSAAPLYAADVPANTPLAPQQVFRYNNHSDPGTLDPQKVEENTAAQIVLDLFEGLVWMDGEGQVQPAQAERWEILDGGKRYIFHLRSGLQWSDGQPLTAEDFVLGWQRAVDPKTASPFAGYLAQAHINNAAAIVAGKADVTSLGVKATDDRTLEVTLEQPVPWFTTMLAWPTLFPVPHHVIAKHGDSWSKPENMVYNGAFVLDQWVVNEKITARKNPKYRDAQHTVLQQVEYLALDNSVTGYNRYRAGEVDLTWVPAQQIPAIEKSLPGELRIIPRLNSEYYNFNLEKPPFNDVRVRRALYLTVDRQLIAQKVLGLRTPATTLTPPEVKGFSATTFDELQKPMSERVAMAKVLLKQAGYDASHPLRFELFYNKYDLHEKTAIALSSEWKKWLGAQVTLRTMEWKTYLDARRAGDFMLSRQSWDATYNDASSFLNTLKSDSEENVGHWKNAQYDALLNQATQITDATKRNALYQQAEVIINQQAPLIPIYYQPLIKLLKPYVGGFPLHNPQDYVYSKELYIKAH
ncbi:TPA: ABC transporter substrate-binding protein [Escherichia coli]|nr:ABC transporter substrate-binding protein [Escherichia coli]